jgi:OPA family sugar phosphate sensor protein UhpC-like MFS transporter
LAYAGYYLTRKAFSVAQVGLFADPSVSFTKENAGVVNFANQVAYSIGQIFWGANGDRFGVRRIVLFGMMGSAILAAFCGVSKTFGAFLILLTLQGFVQATGWSNLVKNMSSWFSQHERGTVMGWWCTNYAIGGLIASPFAGWAAESFGHWSFAFFLPAIALLGIWCLFFFLQSNRPEDEGLPSIEDYHGEEEAVLDEEDEPEEEPEQSWTIVKEVLTNKTVWLLAAVYFFLKPTRYAILAWGPTYVNEQFGSNLLESGSISALFELGGPVGTLVAGFASDKIFRSRRFPVCVIFLFALAILLFFFRDLAVGSKLATGAVLFGVGFLLFGPDSLISGTASMDFGTKKGAATAAGLINCLGSVGGALGAGLPGFISEKYGWNAVFFLLSGASLIGGLLLLPFWNLVPPTADEDEE